MDARKEITPCKRTDNTYVTPKGFEKTYTTPRGSKLNLMDLMYTCVRIGILEPGKH